MQTEEIDVTLNPLSPTGPWTNGLPSTKGWQCPPATATAIATLPFVVGTGVLLEAALRGGGSGGSHAESGAQDVGERIRKVSKGWPQLEVNPEPPFSGKGVGVIRHHQQTNAQPLARRKALLLMIIFRCDD